MKSTECLQIGDHVLVRKIDGGIREHVITNIEITSEPGEKFGLPVRELAWTMRSIMVVDLEDGSFAFGNDIDPVT